MATEQIDPALVEALRKQVKDLRNEVEANRERIEELESSGSTGSGSGSSPSVSGTDSYDAGVLAALSVGDDVSTPELVSLYLSETAIQNKETAKRRAKNLRSTDVFVSVGYGEYRYVGDSDEDEEDVDHE